MIWKDLIKYFISFVTIYFIFNKYGNNIYNILILIDIRYILLIIFLSFIQYMISAYRWMYISRFTNLDINFFYSLKFYYISSFMNNILPGGIVGDIFRIYHSADNKKEILRMGKSFQSVIFERLSGQLMLFAFFIVSLTLYFLVNGKYQAFWYLVIPTIIIFFICNKILAKKTAEISNSRQISKNFLRIFSGEIFWKHFFLSFFVVSSYILIYIISAISLGLDIDYLAFLVFSPIILFSMTLPISIGGWGVREVTALVVSLLLGLSASASISVSIIYGLLNLLCSLPGLYFFISLRSS